MEDACMWRCRGYLSPMVLHIHLHPRADQVEDAGIVCLKYTRH